MRVYNFSAGPATMPLEVLERAQAELIDWRGSGMSVMEMSHRSKEFVTVAAQAEARLRALLAVPEEYAVLFLQGGATGQFAGVPLNLTAPGAAAAYVNTGSWSAKAIDEARKYVDVHVVADEKDSNYTTVPAEGSLEVPGDAAYLHLTLNETIGGVEFPYLPDAGEIPLVTDASSTMLSRPVDVSRFGVIYAGAQKNLGPSGLVVIIVRRDLMGRARPEVPAAMDWTAMAEADSMLNTPPTLAWYLVGLVLEWVEEQGGLTAMAERNRAKAELIYGTIDRSDFYSNPVQPAARSWMNVPFLVPDPALEKPFVAAAEAAGLSGLGGHRSVGGMRASIYNAMPIEGVQALVDFMTDFEKQNG
ncbi:3-phosphoserine/phosphohydroxythreonine transaminase [Ornithinimicrobium pratense]|uniref:Phosphoserine aminotransferase n=1 Tax=Ornithinimicrobium pratense TaxID=2593973 RepID=A0A5J6V5N9_9MICO|nr:3-phosphoserine/phosphohydroxythreonine transaminase [Ornithinimicrobium pratense]QFG68917.1 3-phosphoserine/phosphohydroxythreonine transaminase [Ornithinimicrobium pratense]